MSASAMLSLNVHLDIQPGEIPPTIHLKEGSESIDIHLQIAVTEATLNTVEQPFWKQSGRTIRSCS